MSNRSTNQPSATVYGYPRQGRNRELKATIESYWAGRSSAAELLSAEREIRLQRLREMESAGIAEVPVNDFSLYDHVLDTAWMLGAVPQRHVDAVPDVSTPAGRLDRYFAMARGGPSVAPLEMTKWFDTNYHYLVPELGPQTEFTLDLAKPLAELADARVAGFDARPVILGPISFLLLSKGDANAGDDFVPLSLLDRVLPLYQDLLRALHSAGARWVQIDEPVLVTDQPSAVLDEVSRAYALLTAVSARSRILVATYFDRLGGALPVLAATAVEGIAMDFTGSAAANLDDLAAIGGIPGKRLVAGVVNGRNVWLSDLSRALDQLATLRALADHVDVSASCSLLHVPVDVDVERDIDPTIASWMAFGRQKLGELVLLARGLSSGQAAIAGELQVNQARLALRAGSPVVHVDAVRHRVSEVSSDDLRRHSEYSMRKLAQKGRLQLPALPTTTIGSFPQTEGLRQARAQLRAGTIDVDAYDDAMRAEIRAIVDLQLDLDVDVLVHGEPERNDMVQYFAEQMDGYLATAHGWVQSYGTRYVRPPIIVGDVSRRAPMTVRWAQFAQRLTDRPVKGMLTGPVTMLAWSFVRDDQPLGDTALQVALALRDEVVDLEAVGIAVIQVDEPALRETLPLRAAERPAYLDWAVQSFRLTTSGVRDDTQIHTHMCYAEFSDILAAIVDMDADVISLEAARSDMTIVGDLAAGGYSREVGPGVWDIHSPRVPPTQEIADHLRLAIASISPERLWVNPDCGLKTRGYPEVRASLANLVEAAHLVRAEL